MAQRRLRVGVSVKIAAAGDQQAVPPGKTLQLHGIALPTVFRKYKQHAHAAVGMFTGKARQYLSFKDAEKLAFPQMLPDTVYGK